MSARRVWGGRLWIVAYALAVAFSILGWASNGSTYATFLTGANGVFLLWAISDHLDAERQRLNTELARRRIEMHR